MARAEQCGPGASHSAGGASVTQVQARLGHSTAQETLNPYSHLWPDEDDRTRDVVDALFAAPEALTRLELVPQLS